MRTPKIEAERARLRESFRSALAEVLAWRDTA